MGRAFESASTHSGDEPAIVELATGLYGYVSRVDPNCGFATAADGVLVVDTRATPALARSMLADIRRVSDRGVRYVVLTHYHAARVMGAAAFHGAVVIASRATADWIATRGAREFESEVGRFPRLFEGAEEVRGLTRPDIVFDDRMELRFGERVFELQRLGRGHTGGDAICWAPDCGVAFAGDLVENRCAIYAGDAQVGAWIQMLERLRTLPIDVLVPGRGAVLRGRSAVLGAIDGTRDFLMLLRDSVHDAMGRAADLRGCVEAARAKMESRFGEWPLFDEMLPFDVARMREELSGHEDPTEWSPERDAALRAELA
jgi:glyoxylase-like metal-dependent hydrolase (beta-lactamase superfamily II)